MQVTARCEVSAGELGAIQRLVALLGMLVDLIRVPSAAIADVVVQDEFTHDVVVHLSQRWLVFDAT